MESLAAQHWHNTETFREANTQLFLLDRYESAMNDFESFVAAQQDVGQRIRNLLNLTNLYHREFGVHFEKRHAYRNQLFRVLTGEVDNLDEAKTNAFDHYASTDGAGLPRLERIAQLGTDGLN